MRQATKVAVNAGEPSASSLRRTRSRKSAALAQEAVIDLTRGQLAEHALITVGVLNSEVVDQAAPVARVHSLIVLALAGDRVSSITSFTDNSVLRLFGLPRTLPG